MRGWSNRILLRPLALAAVWGVVSAASASAQVSWGRAIELTAFNGYYIASDLYTTLGAGGGADIGLDNSYMYGGRLGFFPHQRGGLEVAYARTGSDVSIKNGAAGYTPGDLGRLNLDNWDINFIFAQPTSMRSVGFFTIGFGWTVTDPQLSLPPGVNQNSESLFGWNFGLGTKIAFNDKLLLRLEGRWKTTDTNVTTSSSVYCDYWGYCYGYASNWYNSGELTAGLTYKIVAY